MSGADWTEANQQLLAAEFSRLKARLAGADPASAGQQLRAARCALRAAAAIDVLAEMFGLSDFERDVLLLCAGVEMDASLAAQCAASEAGNGTPFVTFGLALAVLDQPHWSALAPVRPLRQWRLLELRDERAVTGGRLCVDERVLHYLAGVNYLDQRLRPLIRLHATPALLGQGQTNTVDEAVAALERRTGESPVVQLSGDDAGGQLEIARRIAERRGQRLHVLRAADIPPHVHEADALSRLWCRESMLLHAVLCLQVEEAEPKAAARFAERLAGMVCITSHQPVTLERGDLRFKVDRPGAAEQKKLWTQALGASAAQLNGSLDSVAAQFRFGADVIVRMANELRANGVADPEVESALWQACRQSIRNRLEDLAHRVDPVATWHDLVLPDSQLATLRQIAGHVRQRMKVYEHWGFGARCARGLGISVLFSGESGTGKTMAAEVLANELHLDLYRIDLASLVSKYIGETEKNLRKVFDAAEDSGAILLFDEADALFGKRSEVKDSHDRYANIEVSYLLQRMETYRGLAILTTNLKGALDIAFQRRLRFIVQFPFPDHVLRERIWRQVFPEDAPLDGLDHRKLAQLNVAGGNIRNIALNAAFLAAEESTALCMSHLLRAARSEAAKRERPFSDAETRGWL